MNVNDVFRLTGSQANIGLMILSLFVLAPVLVFLLTILLLSTCYLKCSDWLGNTIRRRTAVASAKRTRNTLRLVRSRPATLQPRRVPRGDAPARQAVY